jgi:phospholipid transport system substrate-binding protein
MNNAYAAPVTAVMPQMPSNLLVRVDDNEVAGARDFIQSMAQRGIDFLGNSSLTQAQRKEKFRQLLRSSYNMSLIGRFALGPYWKTMSASQQTEYQKLFENMIVDIYSDRFGQYKGQQLNVIGGSKQSDTDITVNSVIVPKDGGDNVQVDWRVRANGGQYKVIDVVVAGVSMALTQRSDFSSVIQRGGGDVNALLESMRNGTIARNTGSSEQ